MIRGRNWVNPLPFPARALAGIVPKPLTLPPREDDAPFPSLAVGALPWPEGKFTSAYQDITLTVKFSVVGHTVGILLGAEPSSADHGMSMAASLPDVQTLSFRCDAAAGMDPAAVTWEKDVCLLASPAAVSLPPPHTNPLSLTDITTAAGKFGQAYVQCASYIGEGYATVAPLAYPVEESDTVIVRRSRSNFVIGQVVGKRPGYLHCRLFLDADIDDSDSDSLFWCYWPDVYEDKAAEVTNISSNPCETETSWHMNCIGPGSRVFVGVRRGSVFTQGFVTKLLESGAQALVQCDNYTERAVPITQLRAVRCVIDTADDAFTDQADMCILITGRA